MQHATDITAFTHRVIAPGAAQGMVFSGRQYLPASPAIRPDQPLIIAIHGGTYTSGYFDVPGYSLLECAAALGMPIVAVDRPGYGQSSALAPAMATIENNAEVLDALVGEIWATAGQGCAGIVLIGHSIGGAVVSMIAARHPSWPLLGIAISGCLLEAPPESRANWAGLPDIALIDLPHAVKDGVMFGPAWTHAASAPAASHAAHAACPRAELIDITSTWPSRVRAVAARVAVPVHFRQGEFDALWITDRAQVEQFGAAFSASPEVDARLFGSCGHCIDFHRPGRAFQLEQLGFALRCSVRRQP